MKQGAKEQELYERLQLVLQSKVEEFEFQQFTTVSKQDLWEYAKSKMWKRKSFDDLSLHEAVADLYSISPTKYISASQVKQFKSENWFSELKKEDLEQLLNPR